MRRAQIIATILTLSFGAGDAALEADDDSTRIDVPPDQWRPATEIVEQFTAMGYRIPGMEGDDVRYEVEAIDPNEPESSDIRRHAEGTE